MKNLFVLLSLLFLSACVTTQPTKPVHPNSFGYQQSSDDCIKKTEKVIRLHLKDPTSAIFQHKPCYKGYMGGGLFSPKEYGYLQTGLVNAKNSYGGYTGFYKYNTLIRNDKVVYYCIADNELGLCTALKPRHQ